MSLLGVSVQVFGAVELLFRVPPEAFTPPPKVESAVVRVDVHERPRVAPDEEERYFEVVRAGFRNPRKQLHNAIAAGLWLPPDTAPDLLRSAGIDPMRRAQTLSLDEWAALARTYSAFNAELDAARARH
jgi:16S rRNA (adenine1518-N6/adenine1519-N6)-dimethyltransferase